jgi:hypothetical protein
MIQPMSEIKEDQLTKEVTQNLDEPLRRREGTVPQKIRFTSPTMNALRDYAARNKVSLSAAVEHLVLAGMDKPNSEIGLEMVAKTLRAEMIRVHNLLIGLLKQTYLEGAIASRAALAVLRKQDERSYSRSKELIRADAVEHMKQSSSLGQLTKYLEEVELYDATNGTADDEVSRPTTTL